MGAKVYLFSKFWIDSYDGRQVIGAFNTVQKSSNSTPTQNYNSIISVLR